MLDFWHLSRRPKPSITCRLGTESLFNFVVIIFLLKMKVNNDSEVASHQTFDVDDFGFGG